MDHGNSDVGDKANDGLRVNADQLKANVIGEGANLGMTQAGRIEFARNGGRLNTDAIEKRFISYQGLGKAIKENKRFVVLMDEIDKNQKCESNH